VTEWLKQLRQRYAASTVVTLRTILSMILDDAVDERLTPTNPVRRRRRRGRRRDHTPTPRERVWAMPDQVLRIAEQATRLGGPSAGLLVITTAWTGCRWGEIAGPHLKGVTGRAPVLLQLSVPLSTTDEETRSPADHIFAGQRELLIKNQLWS
jgi:integrase